MSGFISGLLLTQDGRKTMYSLQLPWRVGCTLQSTSRTIFCLIALLVPPLKVSDSFAGYGADTLMYPPREWWFRYELLCTAK